MATKTGDDPHNLGQARASHAWELVSKVKDGPEFEKFERAAKKTPVRIMTAGLGHAMAFLEAKKEAPALVAAIGERLEQRFPSQADGKALNPQKAAEVVMERIVNSDALFLRRATEEVLAYLQWVNRFAEAAKKEADARDGAAKGGRRDD